MAFCLQLFLKAGEVKSNYSSEAGAGIFSGDLGKNFKIFNFLRIFNENFEHLAKFSLKFGKNVENYNAL